ncbi:MAG: Hpt domain-containing protein [Chloroflexi bacterium]|nr:Hpt domain-containing protein [Chloroflexota bacterium]
MSKAAIDRTTFENLKATTGADFIGELVNTYLEDAPNLIAQMHSALKVNNAEAFRRAAHSLKSNSATFGAGALSELAKELEMLGKENKLNEVGSRLKSVEEAFKVVSGELKGLVA